MDQKGSACVSIVVIGMNEADNLETTFSSIRNINYPKDKLEVIYVDTGSVDKSVEIAGKFADKVFVEKSFWPTPGLARNKGLLEARYDIIHFVDGDIEMGKEYLAKAVIKIQEPHIDAVYGFLEEKSTAGINKIILSSHWKDRKEGYHNATGGGGTYKKQSLLKINGYDERIRKGQETELGERFLKAGFKIWFTEEIMGVHDYGIKKIPILFRIYIIEGINLSHLMITRGTTEFYIKSKKRAINNIIFIFSSLLIFITLFTVYKFLSVLIWLGLLYFYFLLKYIVILKETDIKRLKLRLLSYSMKVIVFAGQIFFLVKCFVIPSFRAKVIKPKMILICQ